ncbi:MAG: hypothetical protein IJS21_00165 [Deltaproteobacteria bacterium]|nr:hypothetical protein [Deltaproteobacteria bacterium]
MEIPPLNETILAFISLHPYNGYFKAFLPNLLAVFLRAGACFLPSAVFRRSPAAVFSSGLASGRAQGRVPLPIAPFRFAQCIRRLSKGAL